MEDDPMLVLELIAAGVFLGLLGGQCRENAENRQLATAVPRTVSSSTSD